MDVGTVSMRVQQAPCRWVLNPVAKTGRLYEFAGECAMHRGSDPWVLPGFASGHIYVGIMKAAMEMMGLAGGPVKGPGDNLTADERETLQEILKEIGLI